MGRISYLLDSNILSEPARLKPDDNVLEQLANLDGEYATASIVWHELVYSCELLAASKRKKQLQSYLAMLLVNGLSILPYDQARVLSRLFRRRFLEALSKAQATRQLQFFGEYAHLADASAFAGWLAPHKKCEWVVYAKRPFAESSAVLAYLSRYTHRVAIANSRLRALDEWGARSAGKTTEPRARRGIKP